MISRPSALRTSVESLTRAWAAAGSGGGCTAYEPRSLAPLERASAASAITLTLIEQQQCSV